MSDNTTQDTDAPLYPIAGARKLPQEDIDLINEIKAHGEATKALIDKVRDYHLNQFRASSTGDETSRLVAEGGHWRQLASESLQDGYIKLVRSVARPHSFA